MATHPMLSDALYPSRGSGSMAPPVIIREGNDGSLPVPGPEVAALCSFRLPMMSSPSCRLLKIEAARRPAAGAMPTEPPFAAPEPAPGGQAQYADFYAWLKNIGRWTPG